MPAEVDFIFQSEDYQRPGTIDIDGKVALTANPGVLQDIAHRRGPAKSLIAFGYARWGPGKLEGELALRAWAKIPDDLRLVFDEDRADVWNEAFQRVPTRP